LSFSISKHITKEKRSNGTCGPLEALKCVPYTAVVAVCAAAAVATPVTIPACHAATVLQLIIVGKIVVINLNNYYKYLIDIY